MNVLRNVLLSVGHLKGIILSSSGRKGLLALLDQATYSGTNFASSLLIARWLSKEEFGAYAIAISLINFVVGMLSSLFTGPMMVLGSYRAKGDDVAYFTSIFQMHFLGAFALAFLVSCSFVLLPSQLSHDLVLAATLLFITTTLQEFFRRQLMTQIRFRALLLSDLIYCGIQISLLFFLAFYGLKLGISLSASSVLACISFSILVGSPIVFRAGRFVLIRMPSVTLWKEYLAEHWSFGRWYVGMSLGGAVFSQLAIVIVAAFGGTVASANFEATRLVVAPAQILLFAAGNYLTPVASQRFAMNGPHDLKNLFTKIFPIWITAFVLYTVVAILLSRPLLSFLYDKKYEGSYELVIMWVLVFFALGLKQLPGTALIAMRRPDVCMMITLILGVMTFVVTVLLTLYGGEMWAVVARMMGELSLFVGFMYYSIKLLSNTRPA